MITVKTFEEHCGGFHYGAKERFLEKYPNGVEVNKESLSDFYRLAAFPWEALNNDNLELMRKRSEVFHFEYQEKVAPIIKKYLKSGSKRDWDSYRKEETPLHEEQIMKRASLFADLILSQGNIT